MAFDFILVGVVFLLVAVIFLFVVRSVMPVSPFLYANARIQSRSLYMVSDKVVRDLSEAGSLSELKSSLRDSDYGEDLDKVQKDDLRSIHFALEKGFRNSLLDLIELSPKQSKEIFNSYLMFLEGKILKVIYRAKFLNIDIDEKLLFSIGRVNEIVLKHLIEAETIADCCVVLEDTNYKDVFAKKYETIEEFETKLDELILTQFIGSLTKAKMYEAKHIIHMLNTKVDIMNILALIKFRIRGLDKEKQKWLLVNNKSELVKRFDDLINAEGFKDLVEGVKGLAYHAPLVLALEMFEKDNQLVNFENSLLKFYKKFVADADLNHTLGPYPLFSYLIKKEMELRNLFVITRGIDAKFSGEKIMGMVI